MPPTGTSKLKDSTPIKLGILLFDGVEVLDFCGPFEVFSIAGKMFDGLVKVTTISENRTINANGLNVIVDEVLDTNKLPEIDVLVVPGGMGTRSACNNQKIIDWITKLAPSLRYIISVCTGVSILGKAGLVDNMIITTHHSAYEFIQGTCPKSKLCKCRRFVDNVRILTSAGISAGIDVSFHFIRKLYGADAAVEIAEHMEYDWRNEEYRDKCQCT